MPECDRALRCPVRCWACCRRCSAQTLSGAASAGSPHSCILPAARAGQVGLHLCSSGAGGSEEAAAVDAGQGAVQQRQARRPWVPSVVPSVVRTCSSATALHASMQAHLAPLGPVCVEQQHAKVAKLKAWVCVAKACGGGQSGRGGRQVGPAAWLMQEDSWQGGLPWCRSS